MKQKITPRSGVRPGGVPLGEQMPPAPPGEAVVPAESIGLDSLPPGVAAAFGIPAELSKEVEVDLPNGKKVVMKEPTVSVSRWQAQITMDLNFKDAKLMSEELTQVLALLYIDSIDGVQVTKPTNVVDREYLEQQLGVPGCHAVKFAYQTHFALSFTTQGFRITKKF